MCIRDSRYCYTRAPQGLASSGDEFCARTDFCFEGVPLLQKLIDDVILEDETLEGVLAKMEEVFKRCREHCIMLSEEKIQIGQRVKFGGFLVDSTSGQVEITPDPALLDDIRKFPTPANLTQLRSFQGLVNQVNSWNPDISQHLEGLRPLLKKYSTFTWTEEMNEEFLKAREVMSNQMTLNPFDDRLETVLVTDASRLNGLGFLLLQKRTDGVEKYNIVQCGSYAINDTQKRYSATELEMLGVFVACKKCAYYLQGLDSFKVMTDHKALVQIFQKDIENIPNPRLRAFREKLMEMSIEAVYLPGKRNEAADALSRVPMWRESGVEDPAEEVFQVRRTLYRRWHGVKKVKKEEKGGKKGVTKAVRSVTPSLNYAREDIQLQKMFKAAAKDELYKSAVAKLLEGASCEDINLSLIHI